MAIHIIFFSIFDYEQDLEIQHKEIDILQEAVAAGGQATVSFGIWRKTKVVIKQFHIENDFQVLKKEAEVHQKLRHPNVVMLLGVCARPPCIVLELMQRGSLGNMLQSKKYSEQIDLALSIRILSDIARGMAYLHSKSILHRDLKSSNVLLDVGWNAKVYNKLTYLSL